MLVSILLIMITAAGAAAQSDQGGLRGAIRDRYGVVPAAEIVLINEDTNATRSAISNAAGEYAFTSVLPATYTIRIMLPGFKTEERKGIRTGPQQFQVLDFSLEVGAIVMPYRAPKAGISAGRKVIHRESPGSSPD
jgi:hypothetical protein